MKELCQSGGQVDLATVRLTSLHQLKPQTARRTREVDAARKRQVANTMRLKPWPGRRLRMSLALRTQVGVVGGEIDDQGWPRGDRQLLPACDGLPLLGIGHHVAIPQIGPVVAA